MFCIRLFCLRHQPPIKFRMKKYLLLFFILLSTVTLRAQSNIYFKQGSAEVDLKYKTNQEVMADFVAGVNEAMREKEDDTVLEYISIETSASPEGDPEQNDRLAMDRARNLKNYLLGILPLSSSQIKAYSKGVDWEGLLQEMKTSIRAAFLTDPNADGSSYTDSGATYRWVYMVNSSGTFYKNTSATWNRTGVYAVPSGWTISDY